jgi:hypothetical protein
LAARIGLGSLPRAAPGGHFVIFGIFGSILAYTPFV